MGRTNTSPGDGSNAGLAYGTPRGKTVLMATSVLVHVGRWNQLTVPDEDGNAWWIYIPADELMRDQVRVDIHLYPFRIHCPELLPSGFDLRHDEPTADIPAYTYRERHGYQ